MDKEFDFNEIGKRMPYRVPETFFEDVQANVLKRAGEEKKTPSHPSVVVGRIHSLGRSSHVVRCRILHRTAEGSYSRGIAP